MNKRTIVWQLFIFAIQWGLMLIGFGLLALDIAPTRLVPSSIPFADALVKAVIALIMSVSWLYVWDRQVRLFVYRQEH